MVNYSKSIIYKLECKDPNVTEIYVGATTNFNKRRYCHKSRCTNEKSAYYDFIVYRFIRFNGGWNNFNMLQIDEVNARNKRHLNQIEAKYIRELKAELNCDIPQDIEGGLDQKEWHKQYYKKNREKFADKGKVYREQNYEAISVQKKKWYYKNIDRCAKQQREYRLKNIDIIRQKKKAYGEVIVKCECGSNVRRDGLNKHKLTKIHQDWVHLPEPNLVFVD